MFDILGPPFHWPIGRQLPWNWGRDLFDRCAVLNLEMDGSSGDFPIIMDSILDLPLEEANSFPQGEFWAPRA